ncbi:MAG: M20/M25/M40 family metallo-hydrolase [Flavobacteriales bacterium]|nr:M20/M25/M40 family metallo-hydrolase [Flavobacteriales bacterium]
MRILFFVITCSALYSQLSVAQVDSTHSRWIDVIYKEALANGEAYENLHVLCKDIGHRLGGSPGADKAIEWGKNLLTQYEFDNVHLMPVEVPNWVRGKTEYGFFSYSDQKYNVALTALGGSVGSYGEITAPIVEAKNLDELKALNRKDVEGKIVFLNKPMDAMAINTGAAYGGAWDIRGHGPSEAARLGASACIIRSLSTAEDKYPHTGGTVYNDSLPQIPAAALSVVDARALSAALKENPLLTFTINLSCEVFPRRMQANVIGEIKGNEFPDKYIVVGGHLDSWDIGEGAMDDGAGIVHSIEVLRTLKAIGYKPRHTIRVVLFINEEFGNDGGIAYADSAKTSGTYHVAAIESDGGGFTPRGFSLQGTDKQFELFQSWSPLLEPYNIHIFKRGGSGVDIGPLKNDQTALFGLTVDNQRYFDYHHSNNDVFENVNKRELLMGAASMTSLVYLLDQSGIPAE